MPAKSTNSSRSTRAQALSRAWRATAILTRPHDHDRDRRPQSPQTRRAGANRPLSSLLTNTPCDDQQQLYKRPRRTTTTTLLMRIVAFVLTIGLSLIAVAIVATVARSPITVAGTNSVSARVVGELEKGDISNCQPAGTIPRGTSAIRITIEPIDVGPEVSVKVLSGSRTLTKGQTPAGWGSAPTVTVPVKPFASPIHGARICTTIGRVVQPYRISGELRHSHPSEVELQALILRMEYLRPGPRSWLSLASSIAYHMGLGRAASGTWIAFLAVLLMLAVVALASRLTLEEL